MPVVSGHLHPVYIRRSGRFSAFFSLFQFFSFFCPAAFGSAFFVFRFLLSGWLGFGCLCVAASRSLCTFLLCRHAGIPNRSYLVSLPVTYRPPMKCSVFKGITSFLQGDHRAFLILVHGNPLLWMKQETVFPDVRAR